MPRCEFRPGRQNCSTQAVVCDTIEAFRTVLAELGSIFTAREVREMLCNHEILEAREQCPAYDSLAKDGTQSPWVK